VYFGGVGRGLVPGERLRNAMGHMGARGVDVISVGTGGDDFHAAARGLYVSLGFTPFPTVSYTKAV